VGGTSYKLEELARAAGTSARTVRYYVQRGLLAAPEFRGKDTAYGREHLVRLRAIRRLQEAYLPLDEIAATLASRSLSEIERIADGHLPKIAARQPSAPVHAPVHAPVPDLSHASTYRRLPLARGVDLTIADDAPPESQRLVAHILEALEAISSSKEGR
jgi:DNA-binding transcriptional MerR regulator